MDVQRLALLRLHHTKTCSHITKHTRQFVSSHVVRMHAWLVSAIEKQTYDEANRPMENTRSNQRILRHHLMEPAWIVVQQFCHILLCICIAKTEGKTPS